MQRYHRERLVDLDSKIEALYTAAMNNPDELAELEAALQNDTDRFLKEKKMGRVRVYDKWGLMAGTRLLELKDKALADMPIFGIF